MKKYLFDEDDVYIICLVAKRLLDKERLDSSERRELGNCLFKLTKYLSDTEIDIDNSTINFKN